MAQSNCFVEVAINVLFAARGKATQLCQCQLLFQLDDPPRERLFLSFERSDFGSMGRQLRHQFCNARFAGARHQILESEPPLRVNLNSPSSASNLILPHGMADHRIDIDAIEDPVELLCRQRHHRSFPARPPEPVFR